ncbi:penicillin-binding protein activator, partial [Desulfobotulus sp.]|uniref:penicillin-binding protein activator n=1 Tax=Desulfobotulus sp. TaxID=1940337 RepID=UPI002A35D1B1
MFFNSLEKAAAHLPQEQVRAMVDAANARGINMPGSGANRVRQEDLLGQANTPEMDMPAPVQGPELEISDFHPGRIGVLLPLTGYYQAAGERGLNGVRMAVNARNRSSGTMFELKIEDTGSDPEQAAAAVHRLGKAGAACILGPMVTAGAAAVQAQALKIPMITLTQQTKILEIGEFIFRNFLTPDDQSRALVSHVMNTRGYKRFAVFYPDEKYGHVYKEAFLQAVEGYGGQVTAKVKYAPGQTDFSARIKPLIHGYQRLDAHGRFVNLVPGESRERNRIYRAKIDFDAVFIPDGPATGAQIAQQLRFHDIRDVILMGTNIWNPKALNEAGDSVLPVIFPVDFDPDSPEETVQNFVADYEAAFGETPDYFAAMGFDTAMEVMDCLSDPGVTSRAGLMQTLKKMGFDRSVTLMEVLLE